MSIASFSIKRPIFITSLVLIMITAGFLSINRLGVDMYPDVEFPFVLVTTVYEGAGPEEIEEQISKPIEDEIASIAGLKAVHSSNLEGVSIVWGEFTLDSDAKYCEQQVRNKITKIRPKLPEGIEEPTIERWAISRDPIVDLVLTADLPDAKLYDFAKNRVKPMLEQVNDVGTVAIRGGTKREIQVELDRNLLNEYKVPATLVTNRMKMSGLNVPAGKQEKGSEEMLVRSIGRFNTVKEIENSVVLFSGDYSNSVTVKSLGKVYDATEDRVMTAYLRDPGISDAPLPCLFLGVYKQSGTNTIAVVDGVYKRLAAINSEMTGLPGNPRIIPIHDGARYIRINVDDVKVTIYLGILLAVVIVYLFLGSFRSTLITGISIPNSLLGGFVMMLIMGFTINVMTLLALTLTVGLLIDDAIVVRENIFRKIEEGMPPTRPRKRARRGDDGGNRHHHHHHSRILPHSLHGGNSWPLLQTVRPHRRLRNAGIPLRRPHGGALSLGLFFGRSTQEAQRPGQELR
jgi:HAE1 family hydrophobic/amphiphilic exporter-1